MPTDPRSAGRHLTSDSGELSGVDREREAPELRQHRAARPPWTSAGALGGRGPSVK